MILTHKQLSEKLWELRFFIGKGYRVYYTVRNKQMFLLLCAGDKSNYKAQNDAIQAAQKMLETLE